jgi:hypothetical protein
MVDHEVLALGDHVPDSVPKQPPDVILAAPEAEEVARQAGAVERMASSPQRTAR